MSFIRIPRYATMGEWAMGDRPDLVDLLDPEMIADRLGVARATVHVWRNRGVLPEPDAIRSGCPLWWVDTIDEWARATGRAHSGSV
jgi:predicted DNA-binding transcriptional regulator AlpA